MQFLTLQITLNYGLLRFNYSILIPYRMTACTRARKSTADYWLTSLCRLLCTFLARDLKMASKEIQEVSTSNGKGENYPRALTFWTKQWISWGHHACLLVIHSLHEGLPTYQAPVSSMMFGISPSGWSKNLQSQTKELWGTGPLDTIQFQSPLVVRRQPAMGMCSFCVKSGSLRSRRQQAQVVRQHALPSVLPPMYLFLWG